MNTQMQVLVCSTDEPHWNSEMVYAYALVDLIMLEARLNNGLLPISVKILIRFQGPTVDALWASSGPIE